MSSPDTTNDSDTSCQTEDKKIVLDTEVVIEHKRVKPRSRNVDSKKTEKIQRYSLRTRSKRKHFVSPSVSKNISKRSKQDFKTPESRESFFDFQKKIPSSKFSLSQRSRSKIFPSKQKRKNTQQCILKRDDSMQSLLSESKSSCIL